MKNIISTLALALAAVAAGAQTQPSDNYQLQPRVVTHYQNPSNVFTQGAITGAVYEPTGVREYTPVSAESMAGRSNPAIQLYPLPARTYTNVVLSQPASYDVYIDVYDLNGVLWQKNTFTAGGNVYSIDVSNLPRGRYSLQVQERGKSLQSVQLDKAE